MNKISILSKRNFKEMLKEPVVLIFSLLVPVVMLVVMQLIFQNVQAQGVEIFRIESFAPAIATFGFSFTMLSIALMITSDKTGAFLSRLLVSPVKPSQYLFSFLPTGLINCICQIIIFYILSFIFNMPFSVGTLLSAVYLIVPALFYCVAGILIGAIANNERQAGPFCSIIISGAGILGGVWMPLESIGGGFLIFCKILPFYNGITPSQSAVLGNYLNLLPMLIVFVYSGVLLALAFYMFNRKCKN